MCRAAVTTAATPSAAAADCNAAPAAGTAPVVRVPTFFLGKQNVDIEQRRCSFALVCPIRIFYCLRNDQVCRLCCSFDCWSPLCFPYAPSIADWTTAGYSSTPHYYQFIVPECHCCNRQGARCNYGVPIPGVADDKFTGSGAHL